MVDIVSLIDHIHSCNNNRKQHTELRPNFEYNFASLENLPNTLSAALIARGELEFFSDF